MKQIIVLVLQIKVLALMVDLTMAKRPSKRVTKWKTETEDYDSTTTGTVTDAKLRRICDMLSGYNFESLLDGCKDVSALSLETRLECSKHVYTGTNYTLEESKEHFVDFCLEFIRISGTLDLKESDEPFDKIPFSVLQTCPDHVELLTISNEYDTWNLFLERKGIHPGDETLVDERKQILVTIMNELVEMSNIENQTHAIIRYWDWCHSYSITKNLEFHEAAKVSEICEFLMARKIWKCFNAKSDFLDILNWWFITKRMKRYESQLDNDFMIFIFLVTSNFYDLRPESTEPDSLKKNTRFMNAATITVEDNMLRVALMDELNMDVLGRDEDLVRRCRKEISTLMNCSEFGACIYLPKQSLFKCKCEYPYSGDTCGDEMPTTINKELFFTDEDEKITEKQTQTVSDNRIPCSKRQRRGSKCLPPNKCFKILRSWVDFTFECIKATTENQSTGIFKGHIESDSAIDSNLYLKVVAVVMIFIACIFPIVGLKDSKNRFRSYYNSSFAIPRSLRHDETQNEDEKHAIEEDSLDKEYGGGSKLNINNLPIFFSKNRAVDDDRRSTVESHQKLSDEKHFNRFLEILKAKTEEVKKNSLNEGKHDEIEKNKKKWKWSLKSDNANISCSVEDTIPVFESKSLDRHLIHACQGWDDEEEEEEEDCDGMTRWVQRWMDGWTINKRKMKDFNIRPLVRALKRGVTWSFKAILKAFSFTRFKFLDI